MAGQLEALEKDYCPPLDAALVSAIASDFDLASPNGLESVRGLLDQLRQDAECEAEDFDASGTGGRHVEVSPSERHEATSEQEASASERNASSSGAASLSNGMRHLSVDGSSETTGSVSGSSSSTFGTYGMVEEERMPLDQQVQTLMDIFPSAKEFSIRHTLRKCGGKWDRAMDELLNQQFLEQSEGDQKLQTKGIDAFTEDQQGRRMSKKNRRNQRRERTQVFHSPINAMDETNHIDATAPNIWANSKSDVEFITSRLDVPYKTVASLYRSEHASLPSTITALLESQSVEEYCKAKEDDTKVQVDAVDLLQEFAGIPYVHAVTLIRLTYPSTATAHELAKVLVRAPQSFRRGSGSGSLHVVPSYAPVSLDSDDVDDVPWTKAKSRRSAHVSASDGQDPAALADFYGGQQQRAFAQASAAYRRGKSDPLMGAAAGYYSQLGRDLASKRQEAAAGAADALVAANSTADTIDLHGVHVADAVRIARAKTEDWWRRRRGVMGLDGRLGEMSGGQALKIVTGQGRHSVGGRARIGPAVGRMLFTEGWRCVVDEGMYTVLGKRR